MTGDNKPKLRLENLELNRETVQDLTEGEMDAARGGGRFVSENVTDPCLHRCPPPFSSPVSGCQACETACCKLA
jgi:hypothetical protein